MLQDTRLPHGLESLSTATAGLVGAAYFEALVERICSVIGVDYAHIGEIDPAARRVQTLAACDRGQFLDNLSYDLEGTPCAEVTAHEYCVHENRITEIFPDDQILADMGFVAYAGYALTSSKGEVMGLLAILDRKPFSQADAIFSILRFVAARTAAELERLRIDRSLQDALVAAQSAVAARDEFLRTITHELRTPLNAIIGFSDLLRASEVDAGRRMEYAGYVFDAGTALLEMVEDMLDLANVQAGRATTRLDDVAIYELVEECVKIAKRRVHDRPVQIACRCPAPATLYVDRRMARRTLVSLLSNAMKYAPPEAEIAVDCAIDAECAEYRIIVSDDGPGMTPEELEKALQPFGRNPQAVSMAIPGVGMGLPLVQALMQAHGGRVEMESAPEKGTRATLVFPMGEQAVADL